MTDRAVFVGRPSPQARMVRLPQPSSPMDAEVSADGTRLVTGDLNGTVTVWNSATPAPVAIFHVTRAFSGEVSQLSGRLESSPGWAAPRAVRMGVRSSPERSTSRRTPRPPTTPSTKLQPATSCSISRPAPYQRTRSPTTGRCPRSRGQPVGSTRSAVPGSTPATRVARWLRWSRPRERGWRG